MKLTSSTNQQQSQEEEKVSIMRVNRYRKPTYIIPFKSDVASKKLIQYKNQLSSCNDFNICFKTTTKIIELTKRVDRAYHKHIAPTPITSSTQSVNNETMSGIIYRAKCKKCQEQKCSSDYIGETGRTLQTRISEHLRLVKVGTPLLEIPSAIGAHSLHAHNEQPKSDAWEFEVLKQSSKTQTRKLLEALYIRTIKPSLNRDNGVYILPIDCPLKFKN
jgi:hypothetical protein